MKLSRWVLVRGAITALAFLCVTLAMSGLPAQAYYVWYLCYSPVMIAALSFGLGGALVASLWAALSLGITLDRAAGDTMRFLSMLTDQPDQLARLLMNNAVAGMALTTGVACLIGWLVDENRRAMSRFELLARTDGLTGVANHRYLMERLEEELARSARFERPAAYLMVDLDGLKGLNDSYGHPAGDAILRDVAQLLKANVRDVDLVGRYGGDEFGVVLADTEDENALATAERLRHLVADRFSTTGNGKPTVTVSIGVAVCPTNGRTWSQLVDAADEALYQTKQKGKNGTTLAPAPAAG